ncbi:1-aminocyclopropane-1-carboxylate synthase 1 [Camellia lanceoleosa]|uniref:1-aminocyclopropane-1-carboxylate synthase 1 n=1 Tax=Camellia lanceoleosa TaxID=1840588 RepID=A0ACC0FEA6_9ERIC|nr:1-aminocyclopropane-1-carboxylate synthase 1 [Camellia lanceoleosa]
MSFNSNNNQKLLSKIATKNEHGENSPYFDGWKAYDSNPYHPTQNPTGVIQMGLAENKVTEIANSIVFEFICSFSSANRGFGVIHNPFFNQISVTSFSARPI